jgi:hypothetical protein
MFSMMKLVVTIFLAVIISAIKADNANLISLNSPAANQMLVPNEQVALQYTIIGVTKSMSIAKTTYACV